MSFLLNKPTPPTSHLSHKSIQPYNPIVHTVAKRNSAAILPTINVSHTTNNLKNLGFNLPNVKNILKQKIIFEPQPKFIRDGISVSDINKVTRENPRDLSHSPTPLRLEPHRYLDNRDIRGSITKKQTNERYRDVNQYNYMDYSDVTRGSKKESPNYRIEHQPP